MNRITQNKFYKKRFICRPLTKEYSDKVILPHSSLDELAFNSWSPMMFSLQKSISVDNKIIYCGVSEFTAEENIIYIPEWIMKNLDIKFNDKVIVINVFLPKGTFVKLQSLDPSFLELSNPKAILERHFGNYTTLTMDQTLVINYMNKTYEFKITQMEPTDAICIIDTDLKLDFEEVEQEPKINEQVIRTNGIKFKKHQETQQKVNIDTDTGDYWSKLGVGRKLNE